MVAGKSPGWLPTGWEEKVKVTDDRKVKCYVDPLTGSKFYSKPQVSKYLKNKKPSMGDLTGGNTSPKLEGSQNMNTLEGASCTSKKMQRGVSKQVVVESVTPDGLPTGWIKEIKIQKKSNGIRKDPYYTDPVSGYVFHSIPDALRFLESGDINRCAIKPRKRHELGFLTEEISARVPSAANMEHSGRHTTKRQYLEGTVSTSTVEDSLNHAIEECAETEGSNEPSRSPVPRTVVSKRELGNSVYAKNRTDQLAVNVSGIISDRKMEINPSKSKKQEAFSLPLRSSERLKGTKTDVVVNLDFSERVLRAAAKTARENEAKPLVCSAHQLLETFSESEIANYVSPGSEAPSNAEESNRNNKPLGYGIFFEGQPASQGTKEREEENMESNILNPVVDSWSDPCLDFAVKTLTGIIQIGEETKESNDTGSSPLPITDSCNTNQCEMVRAEKWTVSAASTDMVQEEKFAQDGLGKKRSRKMPINSSKSKKKEAVSLPRRSSNRLVGISSDMAVNFPLCQHVPESRKSGESEAAKQFPEAWGKVASSASQLFETVEGGKNPMEDQAVQEHQPFRQETEKKDVENLESQFLYPLADSWSDPCLEFAVKTLTGEIPIDYSISIEDYFEQHNDTSYTLQDLGLPNSFQRDILLDFDSTGNPVTGTQVPENPTFRSPENVDLMVCGDNAPQQPSLGGKKE